MNKQMEGERIECTEAELERMSQKIRVRIFFFCLNLYSIYLISVFCYPPTELPFVPVLLVTAQIRFVQLGHAKRH